MQPGLVAEGGTHKERNEKASLEVRHKRSVIKSKMWGNGRGSMLQVALLLPDPLVSSCSLQSLVVSVTARSSSVQQRLGKHHCGG